MKSYFRKVLVEGLEERKLLATFTDGNLAVYRIGDGSAALTSAAQSVFIDEYTPTGTLVQSIALPTAVSGANFPLTASGTATSEGLMTRSADGQYLVLAGYGTAPGTASVANTTGTVVPRVAGRVDATGVINTSTALSDFSSGNNPRGVSSLDGNQFFVTGGAGGIRYATLGSTTSTQLSTTLTNLRSNAISNGQLYVSTSSGSTVRLGTVGTGVPTTAGQTITNLPGIPAGSGSPYGFFFADLDAGVPGDDTVYVADDGSAVGVTKYSLVSGSWVSNGVVGPGLNSIRSITGVVSGGGVTLYASGSNIGAGQAGSTILTFSDTAGYNGAFSGSMTTIVTVPAASNMVFRGIAMAPVASGNNAPTISDTVDQSTNEDTPTMAIPFTVGDVETAPAALTVTATSSNVNLITNASIVLGGSGANRTIELTPIANRVGTSVISITVSDGTATATDTFTITVNPVNDAPTVEDILDQTTGLNTPRVINFTIDDVDLDNNLLTLTGASSNQGLVPDANIVFSGTGSNRTVTITPASNQSGTATITVSVSDGELTTSDTFVLTVAPNTPPTISNIGDQSINEDTATSAIPFTIGDAEQAIGVLTVTATSDNTALIPNGNLVIGGSGANRTIVATPVADGNGSATITVTVSDGITTSSDTYVVNVAPVNDAPTFSVIPNQSIESNGTTGALAFTVNDVDGDLVSVTGSSSNTTLVPNGNIVIAGVGSSRTVTVTPAAGEVGTATITLTGNDGTTTGSTTFVLTVSASFPMYINEVLFNPPGTDAPNEYVEIRGDALASVPSGTYLVGIEGDTGTPNPGDIQLIMDLSGKTFGSNGTMLLLQTGSTYSIPAGTSSYIGTGAGFTGLPGFSGDTTDIENTSVTFFLIRTTTAPTLSIDIDADNDSIADGAAFGSWTILDGVSIADNAADTTYASLVFAVNGTALSTPGATLVSTAGNAANHVARIGASTGSTAADWVAGGLTGTAPSLAYINSQTFPTSLAGARLDHIGAPNNFVAAGVTLSQSGGSTDVTEGGATDSYGVVLNTQPTASVSVTVTPTAQVDLGGGAGVAVTLSFTTANWNVPQTVTVSAVDDVDVEGAHTALITHAIASGSAADYLGLVIPDVTVNITDNEGANQPPVANGQSVSTAEDNSLLVTLTGFDPDSDPLTYTVVTGPANGVLTGTAPNLTYVPNANFHGENTIVFKVNDGTVDSAPATVVITVTPVNDAPTANSQTVSTNEDSAVNVTLTGNDVDGDTLSYIVTTGPANGTLSGVAPNLVYTPNSNFHGSDSFAFKANDGLLDSGAVLVTVNVAPVNDAPVANGQMVNAIQDTPSSVTLSGNDVDGDSLSYMVVSGPLNGVLSGTAPNLTYTPNAGYTGSDSFTFKVNDGTVDSNVATVSISVASSGVIDGTTGQDVFTVTQLVGSFQVSRVTDSGAPTDLGSFSNGSPLTINGMSGDRDKVIFIGGSDQDVAVIGGTTVNWNGSVVTLSGIEDLTVDGAAGNDMMTLVGRPIPTHIPKVGAVAAKNNLVLVGGENDDTFALDADFSLGKVDISDVSGVDTISLGDTSSNVTLNLGLKVLQTVTPNLSLLLASSTAFENAIGGTGNDTLTGNTLANRLTGGAGNDTLIGMTGNDRYIMDGGPGIETITDSSGIDTVDYSASMLGLTVNLLTTTPQTLNGSQTLTLGTSIIEGFVGSQGNDVIVGNNSANFLQGAGGDDDLQGGLGNDTYQFNADNALGTDTINDATGVDTLDFSSTQSNGVTVSLSVSTAQAVNSNLTLVIPTVGLMDNLVGSQANDTLIGHNLTNRLTGMGGDDLLQGMAGNDTYWFRSDIPMGTDTIDDVTGTADVLDFATSVVGVTVDMSLSAAQVVTPMLSLLFASTDQIENVTGSAFADTIVGNTLKNKIIGGAGDDSLNGGDGDDLFVFDTDVLNLGTDTINDNSGVDTLDFSLTTTRAISVNIGSTATQLVNTNLSLIVTSATAFENLIGGSLSDTLIGNINDNRLTGRAGDDMLVGGAGNDSYSFDADLPLGTDMLDESAGGLDTIDFTGTTTVGVTIDLSVPGSQSVTANSSLNLILGSSTAFERVIGTTQNDTIQGNASDNILQGMNGNDNLHGGDGRDLLIGGSGADTMTGGNDDDILAVGTTTYDLNPLGQLFQVFAEWTGANDYATRVNNLKTATGVPSFAKTTVVKKDTGANTVTGGAGDDLFYANGLGTGVLDTVTDKALTEVLEDF